MIVTCDSPNDSHGAALHEKQEHLFQHPGDTFCAEDKSKVWPTSLNFHMGHDFHRKLSSMFSAENMLVSIRSLYRQLCKQQWRVNMYSADTETGSRNPTVWLLDLVTPVCSLRPFSGEGGPASKPPQLPSWLDLHSFSTVHTLTKLFHKAVRCVRHPNV